MAPLVLLVMLGGAVPSLTTTKTGFQWKEDKAAHRLLVQRTAKGGDAQLLVTHEVEGPKNKWSRVFQAKDFVKDCEFDLTLELVPGLAELSDADGDGELEVSFAYLLGCRSDVSPLTMKLLTYEGATKYALRGTNKVIVSELEDGKREFQGGDFEADPAFEPAPKLLEHAKARWAKALEAAGGPR